MIHEETKGLNFINARNIFLSSLLSGGVAGTICDTIFFPLDTLKTRLQSQHGFMKSGGFKQLYQGLGPVMIGSAPASSLFFITYEGTKEIFQPYIPHRYHSFIHMAAASLGEMAACLIRVPVEVVKQRKQALLADSETLGLRMLYRGYGSTVLRDLPFGLIQMPLWEYFKLVWKRQVDRDLKPVEGATCGAVSSNYSFRMVWVLRIFATMFSTVIPQVTISAAITTPLDVAKTRIMLSCTSAGRDEVKISTMLREVYCKHGIKGLFAGISPRVFGFTLGGFAFFGIYEQAKIICASLFPYESSSR